MKQLVLDASPLIALFYGKDNYHQEAVRGFQQLYKDKTQLLIPIPIIFEVYKWLLHKRKLIKKLSRYQKYLS